MPILVFGGTEEVLLVCVDSEQKKASGSETEPELHPRRETPAQFEPYIVAQVERQKTGWCIKKRGEEFSFQRAEFWLV
jgi:hypothetical protein